MSRSLTRQRPLVRLALLASLVPGHQAIVELGVFQGGSLWGLCEGARAGTCPQVFGIDPWGLATNVYASERKEHKFVTDGPANMAIAEATCPDATLIRGFSVDEGLCWEGPPVGMLHVDGLHTPKQAVLDDYWVWESHLAPHALVTFDDYNPRRFPDVVAAVDELTAPDGPLERVGQESVLAITRLR